MPLSMLSIGAMIAPADFFAIFRRAISFLRFDFAFLF